MLRRLIQCKGMRDSFVLFRNLVQYLSSSTQLTRDHAQLRVLSNERSNWMEPYSGLNRSGFNRQHNSHQVLFKGNGDQVSHTHRLERDALLLVLMYRFYKMLCLRVLKTSSFVRDCLFSASGGTCACEPCKTTRPIMRKESCRRLNIALLGSVILMG